MHLLVFSLTCIPAVLAGAGAGAGALREQDLIGPVTERVLDVAVIGSLTLLFALAVRGV